MEYIQISSLHWLEQLWLFSTAGVTPAGFPNPFVPAQKRRDGAKVSPNVQACNESTSISQMLLCNTNS